MLQRPDCHDWYATDGARPEMIPCHFLLVALRMRSLVVLIAMAIASTAGAQTQQPEYQLAAGDVIRVIVFQNPELTLETRVTENGTITYPLVGTLKIGGFT